MNQNRQPRGVPVGGQFAQSERSEAGVSLALVEDGSECERIACETDGHQYEQSEGRIGVRRCHNCGDEYRDLADATPIDIDTELARLYEAEATARSRWASMAEHVAGEVARANGKGWRARASREEVDEALMKAAEGDVKYRDILAAQRRADRYREEADALAEEMKPLNDEFDRRGGWTRAFLVVGANGHVHKNMSCSTCFQTGYDGAGNWREGTRYHWVTEMSDKSEEEVVEAAGQRACTVCYPSAPVDVLNRPTRLFTPDEVEKQKARVEREQAKQDRLAKKIAAGLTADGSEFVVRFEEMSGGHDRDPQTGQDIWSRKMRPRSESFKTERAAEQWVVKYMAWDRDNPDHLAEKQPAFDAVIAAIANKHGKSVTEVRAGIDKKVAAKRKRDGWPD